MNLKEALGVCKGRGFKTVGEALDNMEETAGDMFGLERSEQVLDGIMNEFDDSPLKEDDMLEDVA